MVCVRLGAARGLTKPMVTSSQNGKQEAHESGSRRNLRKFFFFARSFRLIVICLLSCAFLRSTEAQSCASQGVAVQVLGSGGPELQDKRASSSYLVWQDGRPRVLVDAGGGSALRFGESGAQMSDLDVILFTHFHVDHSGDFAALVKSSWFEDRKRPLPIYGPLGNDFMPSTTEFVSDFFGDKHGSYRYLSELLVTGEGGSYQMQPHNVGAARSRKPHFAVANSPCTPSASCTEQFRPWRGGWKSAAGRSRLAETPTAKAKLSSGRQRMRTC